MQLANGRSMRALPALLFAALASASAASCAVDDEMSADGDDVDDDTYEELDPRSDSYGLGGAISFANACTAGPRLTIGAVGDVLLHGPLQKQAVAAKSGDRFSTLWAPIRDLLAAPDVTYANFEGPSAEGVNRAGKAVTDPGMAFDDVVYSSYPMFNYHGALAEDLKSTGVDVVSTANNHSLDRRQLGADRTVDRMRAAGMPFTGTRKRDDGNAAWHTYTTQGGFRLAWVACTYGTNGIPDPDHQVLGCWNDQTEMVSLIKRLRAETGVDAVVVTPHWGDEYNANPNRKQRELARTMIEAGATIVFGSHPHVLQPWEKIETRDGREGFVVYSLGNFVSGQNHLPRRSTMLAYVGLTRTSSGVVINGVSYVPLVMNTRSQVRAVEAIDRAGGSADSRSLTVRMFGTENLQSPDQPIATSRCP